MILELNTLSITSFGFFCLGKFVKRKRLTTDDVRKNWLWRNTFCSFIHSSLASVWVVICYVNKLKLLEDMIDTSTPLSTALVMFSTGYFIYDLIDILIHDKFRQWEIIIHHTAVLTAFGISLYNDKYNGFAVCSLIMEFNSIFLHIRRLMKMSGLESSKYYPVNSILLLLTMIFCRVCTSAWMIRWLLRNRRLLPFLPYVIGLIGMGIIMLTNIGLTYRLAVSGLKRKTASKT